MHLSFWKAEIASPQYRDSCDIYIYKRHTIPTWKRRGQMMVTVGYTDDFGDLHRDEGWGYQIHSWRSWGVIREVFYNGETLGGVMFYADLKAIELGFSLEKPFSIPKFHKRESDE